jgi:hypothetical protein
MSYKCVAQRTRRATTNSSDSPSVWITNWNTDMPCMDNELLQTCTEHLGAFNFQPLKLKITHIWEMGVQQGQGHQVPGNRSDHHDADGLASQKTWRTTQTTMRRYKCAIRESVHSSWYFNIFNIFHIWDPFCSSLETWNFADFTISIFNLITCIRTTSWYTDDNK